MDVEKVLRQTGRAILIAIAILYFLIDALFLALFRPLRRRLNAWEPRRRLAIWVAAQNRYVALLLLGVPWLILEPTKPIAIMMFAHHHHFHSILLFCVSEIIKLALFEQVFVMAKPKLLTFSWFATLYGIWQDIATYLRSLPVIRWLRRYYLSIRTFVVTAVRTLWARL